jgi:hypothetical protein
VHGGDEVTDLDAPAELVTVGTLDECESGFGSEEGPRDIVARADVVADGVDDFARALGRR